MDENKTIANIKSIVQETVKVPEELAVQKKSGAFHSNPILKNCVINSKKTHEKFSLRDLFR